MSASAVHIAQSENLGTSKNICYECGCYKGSVCTGHAALSFTDVTLPQDATSSEATPKAQTNLTPFTMYWTCGVNVQVPILNLTSKERSLLLYAASHCCTVYDYKTDTSEFLSGHQNRIVSMACEATGAYVAVADSGENNIITVWDIKQCMPISTIFNPHDGKHIALITMSPDGRFLASISHENPCSFNIWKWTHGEQTPDGSLLMKSYGTPVGIAFNPNVTDHVMIAFQKQVVFVTWNEVTKELEEPIVPDIRKQKQIGTITGCTYVDRCHNAVASTNEGCILVFGNTLYSQRYEEADLKNEKIFVKTIKVTTAVINFITTVDGYIVTGDSQGNIKFYDKTVKLLYWCQNYKLPPTCSISFDLNPRTFEIRDPYDFNDTITLFTLEGFVDTSEENEILYKNMVPHDFTIKERPFIVRDFIVSTASGSIYRVDYIEKICSPIYHEADDAVAGIDVHDEKPILLIAYTNGRICMYNYNTHERIVEYTVPISFDDDEEPVTLTYIKYSAQALHLACTRSNGEIWLLDQTLLTPKYETPLQGSKSKIEKLYFSQDCKCMAYYDVERTVGLYKYSSEVKNWIFYGKARGHYMSISEMLFSSYSPSRLFTIGQDRNLVEYDLECAPGDFCTLNVERIEQSAVPVTFMHYPVPEGRNKYFLMSDNQFKYKKVNDTTGMCHSIVLGPAYKCYKNSPVYHMSMIPQLDNKFFIFATERHIGIQMLPADGNPFKYLGIVGHPSKIKDIRVSRCAKYLFTVGENDRTVISWNIHVNAVESFCGRGGVDLEPYYGLIEGGRNGWLFAEMQDLFYYMQILHHGENTITRRQVSDNIPIEELPDLMRACGYYMSEFEAENLTTDITYREFDVTGESKTEVSFIEFVQLYINHRPAHGVPFKEVQNSFDVMVNRDGDDLMGTINRDEFVAALCQKGEPFEEQQIHKFLCALMGEDRDYVSDTANFSFLPNKVSFETFVEEILGIDTKKREEEFEEIDETSIDINEYLHF